MFFQLDFVSIPTLQVHQPVIFLLSHQVVVVVVVVVVVASTASIFSPNNSPVNQPLSQSLKQVLFPKVPPAEDEAQFNQDYVGTSSHI